MRLVSLHAALLLLAVTASYACMSPMIITPPETRSADSRIAGLLFIAGASISPQGYEPLLRKVQQTLATEYNVRLWVAVPCFPANTPIRTGQIINQGRAVLEQMYARIGPIPDRSTFRLFFGGHSRGAVFMQDALKQLLTLDNQDENDPFLRYPLGGLMLLSSALQRKYRPDHAGDFPTLPTLTVGGELDGLFRVTRMAEAFYHQVDNRQIDSVDDSAFVNRGVFIIPGANHGSFISGPLPIFVRANDLRSECSEKQIHLVTARLAAAFIAAHHERQESVSSFNSTAARQLLIEGGRINSTYFQPFIRALLLEGSYNLKPACNYLPTSVVGSQQDCWAGSPWSEYAQQLMGRLDSINFNVKDAFWKVYLINPVHLPEIHGSCSQPTKGCTLNITTVSQAVYSLLDNLDTGFYPVGADEIRIKMVSRQAVHFASGLKNANFTELDDNSHNCRDINKQAWKWALDNAPASVKHRFYLRGSRLNIADDLPPSGGGPGWIWGPLRLQRRYDWAERVWYFDVRSPNMRTPLDYVIKASAGFHYCKLLSPARALEWIYIDSLKHPLR